MKYGETPIGIAGDPHLSLDVVTPMAVGGNWQDPSFETDAIVLAPGAFVLLAPAIVQAATEAGDEGRTCLPRRVAELSIAGRAVAILPVAVGGRPGASAPEGWPRPVPSGLALQGNKLGSARFPTASGPRRTGSG